MQLGINVSAKELHGMFDEIDNDGNGRIDFAEFMLVAKSA